MISMNPGQPPQYPLLVGSGLGQTDAELTALAASIREQLTAVGSGVVEPIIADAMRDLPRDLQESLGRKLVTLGVDTRIVEQAITEARRFQSLPGLPITVRQAKIWGVLATMSMAAGAFHGYRRNQSVGWALAWAFLGLMFPVITPTIAVAQGFGKRK
jgi:hypothetical protein